MSGMGWGDAMDMQEESDDKPYLIMSDAEFNQVKENRKRNRDFKDWNAWLHWARRIEGKRRNAKNIKSAIPVREKEFVDVLIGLRKEYQERPQMYFRNVEERNKELYKLETDICKEPAGKWRMQMIWEEENAAVRPAIDALIARVKRGTVAVQNVKHMMAAHTITKFMKNVKKMCDTEWEEQYYQYTYGCHCSCC